MFPKPIPQHHRTILSTDLPPGERIVVVYADADLGAAYCKLHVVRSPHGALYFGVVESGSVLSNITEFDRVLVPSYDIGALATSFGVRSRHCYFMTEALGQSWSGCKSSIEELISLHGYAFDDDPIQICDALVQICNDNPKLLPVSSNKNYTARLTRIRYPVTCGAAEGFVQVDSHFMQYCPQSQIALHMAALMDHGLEVTKLDVQTFDRTEVRYESTARAA